MLIVIGVILPADFEIAYSVDPIPTSVDRSRYFSCQSRATQSTNSGPPSTEPAAPSITSNESQSSSEVPDSNVDGILAVLRDYGRRMMRSFRGTGFGLM